MRTRSRWASGLLLALCVATAPALSITPEQQKAIRAATFEVVVPKPKADPLSYEKPLPLELLPYRERTDAYNSIGTAFALGGNRYVTAGHVLGAAIDSLGGAPALRGSDGVVHAIARITQYSAHEDFAVFSLADDPAPVPFDTFRTPAIDDPVYAVGNALGEGVVIRDGLYTSATPEDQDGRWQWIRFSAAASPGNSGGPLLDAQGRVIGIVIGKSPNENLNYGLPITRVLDAPAGKARYDQRSLATLPWLHGGRTWSFQEEFALPLDWPAFQKAHQGVLVRQAVAARTAIEADHADSLFPRGKGTEALLYDADANQRMPWFIAQQADGNWSAAQPPFESVELPGDGGVYVARAFESAVLLRIVRPDQASDDAFYGDSTGFMDLALKALNLRRQVGNDAVRITSAGKAAQESVHVDAHGRRWQVRAWPLPALEGWVLGAMLPTPDGAAGLVVLAPSSGREAAADLQRRALDLVQLSYRGTLGQWQRFFARHDLLPDELRAFRLEQQPQWRLVGPRFEASVPPALFAAGPGNVLDLTMAFRPDGARVRCEPTDLWWYRDRQWRYALGVHRRQRPPASARQELRNAWRDLEERSGDYGGGWSREAGDAYALSRVAEVPAAAAGQVAADLRYGVTVQVDEAGVRGAAGSIDAMLATALVVREQAGGALVAAHAASGTTPVQLERLAQAEHGLEAWAAGEGGLATLHDPRGHAFADDLHALMAQLRKSATGDAGALAGAEQRIDTLVGYWQAIRRLAVEHRVWSQFVARNQLPAGQQPEAGVLGREQALARLGNDPPDAEALRLAAEAVVGWRDARAARPGGAPEALPPMRARATACPEPTRETSGNAAPAFASMPDFGESYYPAAVKREGIEGKVVLAVSVDANGCADHMGVSVSSGSPELDEAALEGAELIRFKPAVRDGHAVAGTKVFSVTYRLKDDSPPGSPSQ